MSDMRAAALLVLFIGCHAESRDVAHVIAAHRSHDRRIEPSPSLAPRPLAVGQWTLYKISDGKSVGYSKHAVVAVGTCGTWIESTYVADKWDDRFIIKACFQKQKAGPISDSLDDMQAVMTRQGTRTLVIDFRNGQNPRTKQLMKMVYANFATLAWQSAPSVEQQEVVIPAGHFVGSQKIVTRVWIEQSLHGAEAWTHSDVPISGAIKVVGNNGSESVLLDYGLSGAKGELPDFDEHLAATGLE